MVVLTPAEELGLSGLGLDSRLRKAFYALPPSALVEMQRRMEAAAECRKLFYFRDGEVETVRVMLRPLGVMPDQLSYAHYASLTILNALKRLPDLYLEVPAVREVLPLSAAEDQWLRDCWGPSHRETNPVLGRLDAVVEFTSPMWKDSLRFMEPNLCGVGGIHLGPACDQMLAEVVLPVLVEMDPLLQMEVGLDFREVLLQEVLDHLQTIGRAGQNLCFVEPKYEYQGPEEQETLADFYRERHGLNVMHADPSELTIDEGEVCYEGCRIDIAYRDYEVRDLVRLADEGVDVRPLKRLFQDNRIVSSLAGDFDHKSCWELLTDARFTNQYFTAEERQIFRRHVLWTRILSDRETTLPDGREAGDLLRFVRRQHELLVLKPNRSYGGDRIVIGHGLPLADWERAVEAALADPEPWVVQRLASLPVTEFPVVGPDDSVAIEPFYTVLGFAPTRYGLSIVGRASQKQVVNVAQRGGMCGVLISRYQGQLSGPRITTKKSP